jgi:HlyD family secretion protein
VTEVYVAEGELANGLAVELVDTDSLEVVLEVDEVDIGEIAVGQSTVVTLEAWPDRELTGRVVSIAPKAKVQAEIVTYEVHLRVEAGDLPLLTGMTADAELITAERENVLLVPNRAITADREAGKYYVNLMVDDAVLKTEVSIGLRDGDFTEIVDGLSESDRLLIGDLEEEAIFEPGQGQRPPFFGGES